MEVAGQPVPLPPGWQAQLGRETSQVVNGQTMPGIMVNLLYPASNITSSVFVPYQVAGNLTAVSQLFAQRIAILTAIQQL